MKNISFDVVSYAYRSAAAAAIINEVGPGQGMFEAASVLVFH